MKEKVYFPKDYIGTEGKLKYPTQIVGIFLILAIQVTASEILISDELIRIFISVGKAVSQ